MQSKYGKTPICVMSLYINDASTALHLLSGQRPNAIWRGKNKIIMTVVKREAKEKFRKSIGK
jgi:hypothetical protein